MLSLSLLIPFLSLVLAQTCEQYAPTLPGTSTCLCPPGFAGPTCALPGCGGNLFQSTSRQLAQPAAGALYPNITASNCACEDGWSGTGCNVCRSSSACQVAFDASGYNASVAGGTPDLGGVESGQAQNDTVVCNTGAQVYASGELSCEVNNPTIQGLYPLQSTLTILRVLDAALTAYPNVSAVPSANASLYAQLWYAGVEQFFCAASSCAQTLDADGAGSSDWLCQDLRCTCRPNATFCGGSGPATDISQTIDTLGGSLEVSCAPANGSTSGTTCQFKQSVLEQLFGADGLAMSGCVFGECVRQGVIDNASTNSTASTSTSSGPGLSGGVIAGLAVVGAFVLAAILLVLWGWWDQRRARRAGAGTEWSHGREKAGGAGMEWAGLGYTVGTTGAFNFRRSPAKASTLEEGPHLGDGKVILEGVSGRIEPGTMVAILGPSGAGKTTAVELLAGKRKSGHAVGTVSFFGADGAPLEHRPRIGFVDQADILPPNLTVREALLFAARLRLPEALPASDKQARVFEVLTQLGLQGVADTRIGSGARRGISGGEMRRVSIGCELVAAPDILILDEPTSGLDSVSAAAVVRVLRALAHDPAHPTLVLASIHQPSSLLYQAFDKVLLLSAGRSLYFGDGGNAAADWFAARGLPCAPGYNVADHLLEVASDPPDALINGTAVAATTNGHANGSGNGAGAKERGSSGSWDAANLHTASQVAPKRQKGGGRTSPYAATFLTQVQVLSGREWKNLRRDLSLFAAHLAVAVVLGVFTGGLYFHTGITIAGFQSRIGCLFFLGSLLSFSALSALHNLVEIRPLFLRERAGSYYSPTAWLLSRILFDVVPLRIVPTIVVSTITYWMAGLSPTAANFFKFLLILVLYALAMTLLNFLYASVFSNGGIAILLSALFNLAQMTFAGFFVHLDSIPPVLRWIQWLCPLKYALEALSVNEVNSGLMIQDTLQGVPVDVSAQLIMNLLFGFGDGNYYRDVLVLFAFIAGFAIALISVVYFNVRESR